MSPAPTGLTGAAQVPRVSGGGGWAIPGGGGAQLAVVNKISEKRPFGRIRAEERYLDCFWARGGRLVGDFAKSHPFLVASAGVLA